MLLRVFTLTLSLPVRTVSSHPPALLFGTTLLDHYEIRTLSSRHLHDILAHREYLLPPAREIPMRGAINALRRRARTRVHGRSPSHVYRPTPTTAFASNTDALSHAKLLTRKHGIEAAEQEARDSLIRLTRGVTVIFIVQSRPDD